MLFEHRIDPVQVQAFASFFSAEIRGGFVIKNLDFAKQSMRFNIMEGNTFAATATASYGYDVLDMHFYMVSGVT